MATSNRQRIKRVQGWRRSVRRPFGKQRDTWAERKELAGEIRGLGKDVGSMFRKNGSSNGHKGIRWVPASPPGARPSPAAKPASKPQPRPRPRRPVSNEASPRRPAPMGGEAMSPVIQNLIKSAAAVSEVQLDHADEFDEVVRAMGRAMVQVGDALGSFADRCDREVKLDPSVTRPLHDAADSIAEIGDFYTASRDQFRRVYEPYLNPPKNMPDLKFFDGKNGSV